MVGIVLFLSNNHPSRSFPHRCKTRNLNTLFWRIRALTPPWKEWVHVKLRTNPLLAAALLVAATLVPLPHAFAATTYEVTVGEVLADDLTAQSMRFFPSVLKVHQGDAVHFGTDTFETATLLPASVDASSFIETEWGGTTSKWSPFLSDPDEGPGAVKVNLRVLSPSYRCGWPGQPVCDFDASGTSADGVLNSGLSLFVYDDNSAGKKRLSFNVRITAPTGTTFDVLSLSHPTMTMQIQVVAETEAASEQSAIDAEMADLLAVDKATVAAIDAKYRTKRAKVISHGNTIWTAWAGIDTEDVAIRRMYPAKQVIHRGDRVRWKFNKLIHEAHTVSIPLGRALSATDGFPQIVCDRDGDEGTAPDSARDYFLPPYCSDVQQLEIDVPGRLMGTVGDRVYPGNDPRVLDSSGVRGASFADTDAPYTVRFNKRSSKRGFRYTSMNDQIAHIAMRGTVVVKR